MPKVKIIIFYLALIPVFWSNWFSCELFYSYRNEIQISFYSLSLILLLEGIEKEFKIKLSLEIKVAIKKIVEKCNRNLPERFNSEISVTSHTNYNENKEEACRSKEYTSKFMLQKW